MSQRKTSLVKKNPDKQKPLIMKLRIKTKTMFIDLIFSLSTALIKSFSWETHRNQLQEHKQCLLNANKKLHYSRALHQNHCHLGSEKVINFG